MNTHKSHSADVLNDIRDYWYSPSFIALMAERWKLHQIKSMLDVGCGIGHWGQLLIPFLSQDAKTSGIDPEIEWIKAAEDRAQQKNLRNTTYQLGTAEQIPYPDHHFDMVTCQTVLVHVKDVSIALDEMLRVLKPGGLIAIAEPNNLVQRVIFNNLTFHDSINDIVNLLRFELICEHGRENLGKGNASRGDLIPYYFHQARLQSIEVYQSDLADYFIPPYTTPREECALQGLNDENETFWNAAQNEMKEFYLAGSGLPQDFEKYWHLFIQHKNRILDGYKNKTLCSPGGTLMYLISGIKK